MNSAEYAGRARHVMPGGVSSPVRAFGAVGGDPPFIVSGEGSRLTDADGRTYIDLVGSWGPLILGHSPQGVLNAINDAAARGTSFGAPTPDEVLLAETIISALPAVEMVRFVSSGTEATMSALRLARAVTRRNKILKFSGCYHGHVDSLLVSAGSGVMTLGLPDSPGITDATRSETVVCPFNNNEGVLQAFAKFDSEIAAVIVEPVAANMGVVPPAPGFLENLRETCTKHGSLLIFDEVITGFRVGWSGAQGKYGVAPDLTTLGKVIGGGLPVGAYGGRRELMEMVAPSGPVYQAGTLSGNPLSMAAGVATLSRLKDREVYDELERKGARLQEGLTGAARDCGVATTIQRVGSLITTFFRNGEVTNLEEAKASDSLAFKSYFHRMLELGVYLPPSQFEAMFLSLAHTNEDIDTIVESSAKSFKRISN